MRIKSTPGYGSWHTMIARCTDPRNVSYRFYGGRGISVCDRWRDSFADFIADVGPRPDGMWLDRIDSNGNYEPGNCRWATPRQQNRNRRDTIYMTHLGVTRPLADWADECEVKPGTAERRFKAGWPPASVLLPLNGRRRLAAPVEGCRPGWKLSDAQVLEMRALRAAGAKVTELAARYGLTTWHTSEVCTGKVFANLPGAVTPVAGPRSKKDCL